MGGRVPIFVGSNGRASMILRSLPVFFILGALVAHPASGSENANARFVTDLAYTRAQQLVEVEPGRRLNIYCTGTGAPTVVLEGGLTDLTHVWGFVQPELSKRYRTCSYDRAGVGYSDAATRASTAANIVDDLHRLLRAAEIKPPYVLVGASLGGLYVRLYRDTYPDEVLAMVLVDPSHEDQREGYRKLDPRGLTREQWDRDVVGPGLQRRRECIAAISEGAASRSETHEKCSFPPYEQLGSAVRRATDDVQMTVKFQQVQLSEEENAFDASAAQIRAARRGLDDLPLVILTSGPPRAAADKPDPAREARRRAGYAMWRSFHEDLATLSSRAVHRTIDDSGHNIALERPRAVVHAVLEVMAAAK